VLVKWYDYTKWILDRVDQFPKNQRFVLGTRLADAVIGLEIHPDKYRLCATGQGVDFCGFVVRADGRIRVRSAGVRRFRRRYRRRVCASGRRSLAAPARS
jgi:hypothetical protein